MPSGLRYKPAMTLKRTNPDFLNGVPELLLLKMLSTKPMHGYELVQTIRRATGGGLEFGEGCIYPILHRLEADGLVNSRRETVAGRSRVVYRLTAKGTQRLSQNVDTWRRIVRAVSLALQGGEHGEPALVS